MKPTYLLRVDDVCPTMNWSVWDSVEKAISDHDVRPLISVVPDNRDERLVVDRAEDGFWDRVRSWQARGWSIGIHGYQHRYFPTRSRRYAWDGRSEFAGLPYEEQLRRLRCSVELFREEDVRPEVWVAPNHSFDRSTLTAVRTVGLDIVCDGFSVFPYRDARGLFWIPQQLWGFRPRRRGVWTVCLHVNRWTQDEVDALNRSLDRYQELMGDVPGLVDAYGRRLRSPLDVAFGAQRMMQKRLRTRFTVPETAPAGAEP